MAFRTFQSDQESQSTISPPKAASSMKDNECGIVKREILDTDERKAVLPSDVHEHEISKFSHSCEDTNPDPFADSPSGKHQRRVQFQGTNISPCVIPVGLYYNTAHLGHLVNSEVTEPTKPVTSDRDHISDLVGDRGSHCVSDLVGDRGSDCFSSTTSKIQLIQPDTCNQNPARLFGSPHLRKRPHTQKRPYKCGICKKTFSGHLKRHELTHSGEKPHTCNTCGKNFTQSSSLKQHELTHTGEKPHTCNFCSKTFTRSDYLKQHKLIHTGEKPHMCNLCSKTFTRSDHLKEHKLTHTLEKKYICNFCSKTFSRARNLKQHQLVHTGEKPYTCNFCGKSFTVFCNLKRHEKNHIPVTDAMKHSDHLGAFNDMLEESCKLVDTNKHIMGKTLHM